MSATYYQVDYRGENFFTYFEFFFKLYLQLFFVRLFSIKSDKENVVMFLMVTTLYKQNESENYFHNILFIKVIF